MQFTHRDGLWPGELLQEASFLPRTGQPPCKSVPQFCLSLWNLFQSVQWVSWWFGWTTYSPTGTQMPKGQRSPDKCSYLVCWIKLNSNRVHALFFISLGGREQKEIRIEHWIHTVLLKNSPLFNTHTLIYPHTHMCICMHTCASHSEETLGSPPLAWKARLQETIKYWYLYILVSSFQIQTAPTGAITGTYLTP